MSQFAALLILRKWKKFFSLSPILKFLLFRLLPVVYQTTVEALVVFPDDKTCNSFNSSVALITVVKVQ